jgi:hypothetical protein
MSSGGFSGEVHTVLSYNGYIFDLGTKNPNLLVAFIGSSPKVSEVEHFIQQVYGPNISVTVDNRAVATVEPLDVQEILQESNLKFIPKPAPKPLVFPTLPTLNTAKAEIDQKLEEILNRTTEKGFEYNEESKQKLINRAEAVLYELYKNEDIPRNASKVLQQELDLYRSISREYGPTSRKRIRQQLVLDQLIRRYATQYGIELK